MFTALPVTPETWPGGFCGVFSRVGAQHGFPSIFRTSLVYSGFLSNEIRDDARFLDARKFLVKSLKGKDELLVIHSEEVKHGGVKIPDVDGVFDDVVAEVVRLSVVHTPFDSTACEPAGKTTRVMIPTIVFAGDVSLPVNGASEFAHEDDQSIFKKSP